MNDTWYIFEVFHLKDGVCHYKYEGRSISGPHAKDFFEQATYHRVWIITGKERILATHDTELRIL